jgi:hypothetical protein
MSNPGREPALSLTVPASRPRPTPWWERAAAETSVIELSAITSLLMLVAYSDAASQLNTPLMSLAVAGLLLRYLRERAEFWLLVSCILVVRHFTHWYGLDNHQWLLTYWFVAAGLCRLARDRDAALQLCARLLVGSCFLLAFAWKLATPEFRDGAFFEITLLTDSRFAGLAQVAADLPASRIQALGASIRELLSTGGQVESVVFASPPRLQVVSRLLTAWTLLIEGALALGFLWPRPPALVRKGRHLLLLTFVVTTYAVAPVIGFGWVLIAIALATCAGESTRIRCLYLAIYIALPLGKLPFGRLVGL